MYVLIVDKGVRNVGMVSEGGVRIQDGAAQAMQEWRENGKRGLFPRFEIEQWDRGERLMRWDLHWDEHGLQWIWTPKPRF